MFLFAIKLCYDASVVFLNSLKKWPTTNKRLHKSGLVKAVMMKIPLSSSSSVLTVQKSHTKFVEYGRNLI